MIWLHCKVRLLQVLDTTLIYWRLRRKKQWLKKDLALLAQYFFHNPYRIYKKHALKQGIDPYGYGETPLAVWMAIFEALDLSSKDTFIDLGCGRGRGVFMASYAYGAKAIGIECIETFVQKAKRKPSMETQFICQDFETISLENVSAVYFYGLFYDDNRKKELKSLFSKLPQRAKVASISFSISEYLGETNWEIIAIQEVIFPWGKTELIIENKL